MLCATIIALLSAFGQGLADKPVTFEALDVTLADALGMLATASGVKVDFPKNLGPAKLRYSTGDQGRPIGVVLEELFESPNVTPCWYFAANDHIQVIADPIIPAFEFRKGDSTKEVVTRLLDKLGRDGEFPPFFSGSMGYGMTYGNAPGHRLLRDVLLSVGMRFTPMGRTYKIEYANADYIRLRERRARVEVLGETGEDRAEGFSADGGSYFLLTSTRLTQYDARTGEQIHVAPILDGRTMTISPAGKYVAVGTASQLVLLSQSNVEEQLATVPTVTGNAPRVEFSEDDGYFMLWDPFRWAIHKSSEPRTPFRELKKEFEDLKPKRLFFAGSDPNHVVIETDEKWLCVRTLGFAVEWQVPKLGYTLFARRSRFIETVTIKNTVVIWQRFMYGGAAPEVTWPIVGKQIPKLWFDGENLVGAFRVPGKNNTVEVAQFVKTFSAAKATKRSQVAFKPGEAAAIAAAMAPKPDAARPKPPIMRKEVPRAITLGADSNTIYLRLEDRTEAFDLQKGQYATKFVAPPEKAQSDPPYRADADRAQVRVHGPSGVLLTLSLKETYGADDQNIETPIVGVDPFGKVLLVDFRNEIRAYSVPEGKGLWSSPNISASGFAFSPGGKFAAAQMPEPSRAADTLRILDLATGASVYEGPGQVALMDERLANFYVAANLRLFVVDRNGKTLQTGGGPEADRVRQLELTADGKRLVGLTNSGVVAVWNAETAQHVISHVSMPGGRFVTYTPDRYYMASRGAASILEFKKGDTRMAFDQFDLRLNRPDIVLGRLGADRTIVRDLFEAYCRRLRKVGFKVAKKEDFREADKDTWIDAAVNDIAALFDDYSLPVLSVKSKVPGEIESDHLDLDVEVVDRTTTLQNLNVFVNGCPALGIKGRDLNTSTFNDRVPVELTPGRNVIKLVVRNKRGGESVRRFTTVCKIQATKPDLYVVGVGTNSYTGGFEGLSAENDVARLTAYYAKLKGTAFREVFIERYVATASTADVPAKIAAFVAKARPIDHVVVFYGGHGLLPQTDPDRAVSDYYLAARDTRRGELRSTAIPFDAFNEAIGSTKARQVLVLVDACHAGEQDDEARTPIEVVEDVARLHGPLEIVQERLRSGVIRYRTDPTNRPPNSSSAFALMKDMFADMRRGSGAVMIGAAAGDQYAVDNGKNGLFTDCVVRGLEGGADADKNQAITVEELVSFVGNEVVRLTEGRQKPETRQENLDNDFLVGKSLASLPKAPAPPKKPAPKPAKKAGKKRGG